MSSKSAINIHTYTSKPQNFFVNSYLIETPSSLVLIDTQFILSEAQGVKELIGKIGKPLRAIFVTHPHPDHFNGTNLLTTGDTKVYATISTIQGIHQVEAAKRETWTPVYGDDYPKTTYIPDAILSSGEAVTIDGLSCRINDLGVGETSNMSVVELVGHSILFAGDLAYNEVHPWLVEQHSITWIEQIEKAIKDFSHISTFYFGHGQSGNIDILKMQIDYIKKFREAVNARLNDKKLLDEQNKKELYLFILDQYPSYELQGLVRLNIDAMAQELVR